MLSVEAWAVTDRARLATDLFMLISGLASMASLALSEYAGYMMRTMRGEFPLSGLLQAVWMAGIGLTLVVWYWMLFDCYRRRRWDPACRRWLFGLAFVLWMAWPYYYWLVRRRRPTPQL